MNNDIKIIFVDIDSTIFLHPERIFDLESIEALKKAQLNGVKVYLSTARPYHAVKQIKLFDIFNPDGLVCSNGATLFINDELIYSDYFAKEYLDNFTKVITKYNFNAEYIEAKRCFLINNYLRKLDKYYDEFQQDVPVVEKYINQPITKILLCMPKKYDEKIFPLLPHPLVAYRFLDNMVDIMPVLPNKGIGVNKILDYLKISKDNAMAIGDDVIDITMFEQVKYKVAMGNACKEAKESANYITSSCHEHGVKEILLKLEVI